MEKDQINGALSTLIFGSFSGIGYTVLSKVDWDSVKEIYSDGDNMAVALTSTFVGIPLIGTIAATYFTIDSIASVYKNKKFPITKSLVDKLFS